MLTILTQQRCSVEVLACPCLAYMTLCFHIFLHVIMICMAQCHCLYKTVGRSAVFGNDHNFQPKVQLKVLQTVMATPTLGQQFESRGTLFDPKTLPVRSHIKLMNETVVEQLIKLGLQNCFAWNWLVHGRFTGRKGLGKMASKLFFDWPSLSGCSTACTIPPMWKPQNWQHVSVLIPIDLQANVHHTACASLKGAMGFGDPLKIFKN